MVGVWGGLTRGAEGPVGGGLRLRDRVRKDGKISAGCGESGMKGWSIHPIGDG